MPAASTVGTADYGALRAMNCRNRRGNTREGPGSTAAERQARRLPRRCTTEQLIYARIWAAQQPGSLAQPASQLASKQRMHALITSNSRTVIDDPRASRRTPPRSLSWKSRNTARRPHSPTPVGIPTASPSSTNYWPFSNSVLDAPQRKVHSTCPAPREHAQDQLTAEDRRGLTPLFWQHVLPYGEVKLDMTARLTIRTAAPPSAP
jgi:hypothetical protein